MSEWTKPEFICVVTGQSGATKHHLMTQKAHPDKIKEHWNQIPLSHKLHMEAHQIGLNRFADKYASVFEWLVTHGWYKCPVMHKWRHD